MAGTQSELLGVGHVRRREGGCASAATGERRGATEKGVAAPDGRLTPESLIEVSYSGFGSDVDMAPIIIRLQA